MISKRARHAKILEIIRRQRVESQEELSSLLRDECVKVTQATISRDIGELELVKVRGRYQADTAPVLALHLNTLRNVLAQFVIRTDSADNIVVVRTSPGNAHSVCVALDAAEWSESAGTIAGDDTIFILTRNPDDCGRVLDRIRELAV